jgi:late competence protein required for DNA uptake (superfamily II DNA/RNA helicase)
LEETLFAVKTARQFHTSRLQVVRHTWAKVADNVLFVSDLGPILQNYIRQKNSGFKFHPQI